MPGTRKCRLPLLKIVANPRIINAMSPESYPTAVQDKSSFEALLDNTCDRLEDKHAQYSIRRLDEMDTILGKLEAELDVLIRKAANSP